MMKKYAIYMHHKASGSFLKVLCLDTNKVFSWCKRRGKWIPSVYSARTCHLNMELIGVRRMSLK